jgi:hypothetical protein
MADLMDIDDERKRLVEDIRGYRTERAIDDILAVCQLPQGRRMLWWLLEEAGINRTSFHEDPYRTAFYEGKRSYGLTLVDRLNKADRKLIQKMNEEHYSEVESNKAQLKKLNAKVGQ